MSDIEFLIDENILGLDRFLDGYEIKYRKIGDPDCPKRGSKDPEVAKFAQKNKLVVLTNDDKLTKQCDLLDVEYLFMDLRDFAKKVNEYSKSH
ncbi:hypothetical protein [Candidatus Nitrosarchaeum limnium]|uniref:DUF5615 domain-containing protein n=1 Tax=Candidatus Nitrosarchaeum limnium BG20 TaxID=859192 RepID=S2EV60_9ARCH|nr:hypothetical protein [Candidatus Nitrosarchaeum limnium]EPA06169.1 hypothetical protein BG20_I0834 [Candidatus Nitrosarchaeum limnium BG20]